jgi:hypothetical protein
MKIAARGPSGQPQSKLLFLACSILCWLRDSSSASLRNEYCPVLGILVVLRFPFGTALGIYTLWVLAPEESAREYDQLINSRVQINRAGLSASGTR